MDPQFIQLLRRFLPRFTNRRGFLWMALAVLLAVLTSTLAGCSTGSTSTVPTAINTRSGTNTESPAITSNSATPGADWPTYHRDNARSGYLSDMPDPQQLTVAWNTPLDGAVYAEPRKHSIQWRDQFRFMLQCATRCGDPPSKRRTVRYTVLRSQRDQVSCSLPMQATVLCPALFSTPQILHSSMARLLVMA